MQKIKFEKPRAKYKAEHETELKQFIIKLSLSITVILHMVIVTDIDVYKRQLLYWEQVY